MAKQEIMDVGETKGSANFPEPGSRTGDIVAVIEKAMYSTDVDVAKMGQIIDLYERIMTRDAAAQFAAALPGLQAELPIIEKKGVATRTSSRTGSDAGSYKYPKWEDINRAIKPVLAKHGFSLDFNVENADGTVTVTGILRHAAGHEKTAQLSLPYDSTGSKNTVQSIGSSTQYGKRYTAMAVLNLSSYVDEDDDGEAGGLQTIDMDQYTELRARLEAVGVDEDRFCKRYRIDDLDQLPTSKFRLAMTELDLKAERAKNAK